MTAAHHGRSHFDRLDHSVKNKLVSFKKRVVPQPPGSYPGNLLAPSRPEGCSDPPLSQHGPKIKPDVTIRVRHDQ
jgi:hypothetical protein